MKKRNLKNLKLNKNTVSLIKNNGGAEQSARRTNCDLCNSNPNHTNGCPVKKCHSFDGGHSCGWICTLGDYTHTWSSN
ncbi:hypothetical protein [Kordia sp.]|uniref:hypothetical protein n=1 Tax=Kordia sp. TaxID=1965332 RepID=UPI003B59E0C8